MKREALKRPLPATTIAGTAKLPDEDALATQDAETPSRRVATTQHCSHWSPLIPPRSPMAKPH